MIAFAQGGPGYRVLCLVLACLLLCSACSPHAHRVRSGPLDESQVEEILEKVEVGDTVQLRLLDGTRQKGKLTCADEELLCFGRTRVSWDQIAEIEFSESVPLSTGDKIGLGFVVVLTACVGLLVWVASQFDEGSFGR